MNALSARKRICRAPRCCGRIYKNNDEMGQVGARCLLDDDESIRPARLLIFFFFSVGGRPRSRVCLSSYDTGINNLSLNIIKLGVLAGQRGRDVSVVVP